MGQPTLDGGIFDVGASRRRISRCQNKVSDPEYIGIKKQTQGTETSKYLEERTSTETPLVVASERGPGQCSVESKRNCLERQASEGDSPLRVRIGRDSSKAGHVQSCLNMGGPPSKPKYSSATDSEPVP
jgi:hypothetical protein